MTPLGFSGLHIETLIVVWVAALVVAAVEVAVVKGQNRLPAHPVLVFASRYVRFGCLFTVFAVVQRANDLGLITRGLYLFTLLMAVLAVLAASVFPIRAKS
jgi:hypothetical protein